MNNKGWVKLWRSIFDHWLSDRKPWCDGYAWCYLVSQANHVKGMVNFRNQYIEIERGQFLTSHLKLKEIFGWSRQRTIGYLMSLKTDSMIDIRKNNRFIVITILNYDTYQSNEDNNGTTEYTTDGTTDGTTDDHKQEVKKYKKYKKENIKEKSLFGEYVYLTDEEHQKLIEKFGEVIFNWWIQRMDEYAVQKARKFKEYTSHYQTILTWDRMKQEKEMKPEKEDFSMRGIERI